MANCPMCGAPLPSEAKECPYCNTTTAASEKEKTEAAPFIVPTAELLKNVDQLKQPKLIQTIFTIVFVIFLIIFIIGFITSLYNITRIHNDMRSFYALPQLYHLVF